MHRYCPFLIALIVVLTSGAAMADAPPEPADGPRRACSLNGHWCVVEQRAAPAGQGGQSGSVRVYERGSSVHGASDSPPGTLPLPRLQWSSPIHIIGSLAVTNDGACVIDLATGSNLIPLDKKPDDLAFAFYCRGSVPRVLSLRKFIVDFETLPRATSHRIWAESFGLDEHDHLVVHTAEGRDFLIDPHDGALIQGAYAH
jgi:hypothetical protein